MARKDVRFPFDLDGTLVDSVYQHVVEWQEALAGRAAAAGGRAARRRA
jgi:beta-phosphoglucomutase-like phosphatase (HAD superfamily)